MPESTSLEILFVFPAYASATPGYETSNQCIKFLQSFSNYIIYLFLYTYLSIHLNKEVTYVYISMKYQIVLLNLEPGCPTGNPKLQESVCVCACLKVKDINKWIISSGIKR